jgi:hypothetical protein
VSIATVTTCRVELVVITAVDAPPEPLPEPAPLPLEPAEPLPDLLAAGLAPLRGVPAPLPDEFLRLGLGLFLCGVLVPGLVGVVVGAPGVVVVGAVVVGVVVAGVVADGVVVPGAAGALAT